MEKKSESKIEEGYESKRTIEQIQDKTPQSNKDLRNSINQQDLRNKYSPSINRYLKSLKSLSPIGAQGCKVETDIWDEKKGKCFGWKSKKAKDIMFKYTVDTPQGRKIKGSIDDYTRAIGDIPKKIKELQKKIKAVENPTANDTEEQD